MKLRRWQSECTDKALSNYLMGKNHFLALATPGAGKTVMASVLAKQLYEQGLIDLVLCFSPSSIVAQDFSDGLSEQFNAHFDGEIGALGNSFTYQRLNTLSEKTWRLFSKYRVFVIFDEIHHCAGSCVKDANAWGEPIIERIKGKAKYTIALTGTPWRSDALPIALSQYCSQTKKIQCDYIYGLKEAIRDKVCRIPQVVAVDNDKITIVEGDETIHFNSFMELLAQSSIPYSEIVENDKVIKQLLIRAKSKLEQLRSVNLVAGGLIVASSISHASQIQQILYQELGEHAVVVTSHEDEPNDIIRQFRNTCDKWIISVGMISEGTNIPRLQVCCHLANIKTELHFRQILGRILRMTDSPNQEAVLLMPAEPKLVEYAYRVGQDIPTEADVVKFETMDDSFESNLVDSTSGLELKISDNINIKVDESPLQELESTSSKTGWIDTYNISDNKLAESYETTMGIFGSFNHEALNLDLLGHCHCDLSNNQISILYQIDTELYHNFIG